MIARLTAFLITLSFYLTTIAQTSGIISGPMLGPVELRDAKIWLEVSPAVKSVSLQYKKKGDTKTKTILYKGQLGNEFNPLQVTVGGLEFNTTYEYQFIINGKLSAAKGEATTKDLWPYRRPVPDFSFLTGSCSYFNEPAYDRVYMDMVQLNRLATPYGKDSSIFESMAKEASLQAGSKPSFMLWLGDNWYTRDVDYLSEWGLWYRASRDRAMPALQKFLKSMPHIATWDDHDFGPNDIGKNYILKNTSREIWKNYWCNPSYGENDQGIYTMYSWADTDIFLTDDRWWRSADRMKDSIDGKPNPDKRMLGRQQMEWLKNSLLFSNATFKIIVVGSQVLNPVSPFDKLRKFPAEYDELMKFLSDYSINGILFLTGDRHHSEIIKTDRPGSYPLYDITVSPLTSGTHKFFGPEINNPYRVFALDEKQNYARFTFSGKTFERKLTVEFLGTDGEKLGEWSVMGNELRNR
jgi:alkaline phosphatase D